MFPKGFRCETQVIATVLSHDRENDPDMLAMVGASAALTLSDIPLHGPIAAVRVGRLGGELVINPTTSQLEESDLNLIVAAGRDAIVMVEGGAQVIPENELLEALFAAHDAVQPLLDLQDELHAGGRQAEARGGDTVAGHGARSGGAGASPCRVYGRRWATASSRSATPLSIRRTTKRRPASAETTRVGARR